MKYNYPQGMIAFVPEGSTVPGGWSRLSAADGKWIRSGVTHGNTGGGSGHTHTFDPPILNSGATTVGYVSVGIPTGWWVVKNAHKHNIDRNEVVSGNSVVEPPYINVLVIEKD